LSETIVLYDEPFFGGECHNAEMDFYWNILLISPWIM